MALSEAIINDNPLDFTMTGHAVADHKVKIRLDILGTYILNSAENIRTDVMSRYKEKRRPFQERSVSTISDGFKLIIEDNYYSTMTTEAM
jgi:hypothetical protein